MEKNDLDKVLASLSIKQKDNAIKYLCEQIGIINLLIDSDNHIMWQGAYGYGNDPLQIISEDQKANSSFLGRFLGDNALKVEPNQNMLDSIFIASLKGYDIYLDSMLKYLFLPKNSQIEFYLIQADLNITEK